jgi:hypothetical protein
VELPKASELKSILKVCRDNGVESIEIGSIKVKFGDIPSQEVSALPPELQLKPVPSPEELAYWSSAPDPLEAMREAQ